METGAREAKEEEDFLARMEDTDSTQVISVALQMDKMEKMGDQVVKEGMEAMEVIQEPSQFEPVYKMWILCI